MHLNSLNWNRNTVSLILLFSAIAFSFVVDGYSQSNALPYTKLELNDLNDFQLPPENWELAGDLFMDIMADHDVQPESGTGILVNTNSGDNPQDIFTVWEHGDLDLELEFMMARNSNSGIYLQGRYEVQMLDSWGVRHPKFYDMGGIYQWIENEEGVGGIAPRVNASRAPGLWQHLSIKFRAPRFNESGQKTSHASLEEVKLNGVIIHRHINLVHPTAGAVSNEETAKGPLRFQGDHGPVAFRNIRYKAYDTDPLKIENFTYNYFEGEFESAADIETRAPESKGSLDRLNIDMLNRSGNFGIIYQGQLLIEESGDYLFYIRSDGGYRLTVNGNALSEADDDNRRSHSNPVTIYLDEGSHPIEIVYFRGARGGQPALGLMAEGPSVKKHPLHADGSLPVARENIPYLVKPVREPVVMHGFMNMEDRVHTHTAAVGYPEKVNFAFDQNNGALMKIWKGDFLDASTMWLSRGGGNLSLNEEAAITLGGAPSLAYLSGGDEAWPDSLQDGVEYRFNNYRIDDEKGLTFNYQLDQVLIEEQITPSAEGKELNRKITFTSVEHTEELFLRIVRGESIQQLPNNLYEVNDKSFYISFDEETGREVRIRQIAGEQELIIPVQISNEISFNYSYIW